jgi:L-cystine uptake protein TcyP (sodium:dicarboxylate symporter family)
LEDAVDRAVNECIQENILKEFLMKNKAEVIAVSIFEYNLNITKKRKKRSYGKRNSIMDWSREYEEECSKECNKVWNVEIYCV